MLKPVLSGGSDARRLQPSVPACRPTPQLPAPRGWSFSSSELLYAAVSALLPYLAAVILLLVSGPSGVG